MAHDNVWEPLSKKRRLDSLIHSNTSDTLLDLPDDTLITIIVDHLDIKEIFQLSRICSTFKAFIYEKMLTPLIHEAICQKAHQTPPHTFFAALEQNPVLFNYQLCHLQCTINITHTFPQQSQISAYHIRLLFKQKDIDEKQLEQLCLEGYCTDKTKRELLAILDSSYGLGHCAAYI